MVEFHHFDRVVREVECVELLPMRRSVRESIASCCVLIVAVAMLAPVDGLLQWVSGSWVGSWLGWLQAESSDGSGLPVDKLVHLGLFAGLTIVVVWAAGSVRPALWRRGSLLLVYGWALEMAQSLVAARGTDWLDGLCNSLGVLGAIAWIDLRDRRTQASRWR